MQKSHNSTTTTDSTIRVLDSSSPTSTSTFNGGTLPACAACRHQRKKCTQNCVLAPFFPSEKTLDFQSVHRVFGVSNVTKLVKGLTPEDAKKAVESLIWEANCRVNDPVLGPLGEFQRVCEELRFYKTHYQLANIHHNNIRQVPIRQPRLIGSWNGDNNNNNNGNVMINNGSMMDYIHSNIGIAGGVDINNNHLVLNYGSLQSMERPLKKERDQQQGSVIHPQQQMMNEFSQYY